MSGSRAIVLDYAALIQARLKGKDVRTQETLFAFVRFIEENFRHDVAMAIARERLVDRFMEEKGHAGFLGQRHRVKT